MQSEKEKMIAVEFAAPKKQFAPCCFQGTKKLLTADENLLITEMKAILFSKAGAMCAYCGMLCEFFYACELLTASQQVTMPEILCCIQYDIPRSFLRQYYKGSPQVSLLLAGMKTAHECTSKSACRKCFSHTGMMNTLASCALLT